MSDIVVQAGSIVGGIHLNQPQSTRRSPPHELPPKVYAFTDRSEQLAQMNQLLAGTEDTVSTAAMVISAVSGTAGVGKTAFATHWAHQVSDRFPDGQLYANLHGFGPDEPVSANDVLAGFLRSLGVPNKDIPQELDERAARFRSLVASRRMLIMLDNAAKADQVRPLLPGTSSCIVLVTSRDVLQGLVSRDGARRVNLDLLPQDKAVELLQTLIGSRVDEEPVAAAMLAQVCGRLPLALRIAADQAAMKEKASLTELVSDLEDEQDRLDGLNTGDDSITTIRAVFSWSYRNLPANQARAFRLLGLHPGRDFEPTNVAALIGIDRSNKKFLAEAKSLLEALVYKHLVERTGTKRYQMHDLLRVYAADLANNEESAAEQETALRRLFDFFLGTASAAMDLLYPQERDRRPQVPADSSASLKNADQAKDWLDIERPALLAMVARTSHSSWADFTIKLSATIYRFMDSHGYFEDAVTLHAAAVAAGPKLNNPVEVGRALQNLGSAYQRLGRYEEAVAYLQKSLVATRQVGNPMVEAFALSDLGLAFMLLGQYDEALDDLFSALLLFEQQQDPTGQGQVLNNIGLVLVRQKQYDEAVRKIQRAYKLFDRTGDRPRMGYALNDLGAVFQRLGNYDEALSQHKDALALSHDTGDRALEAAALNGLGNSNRLAERMESVFEHHDKALTIAQQIGDRYEEAQAHEGLANAHEVLGDRQQTRDHLHHAYRIYDDLGAPEADAVRQRLAELSD